MRRRHRLEAGGDLLEPRQASFVASWSECPDLLRDLQRRIVALRALNGQSFRSPKLIVSPHVLGHRNGAISTSASNSSDRTTPVSVMNRRSTSAPSVVAPTQRGQDHVQVVSGQPALTSDHVAGPEALAERGKVDDGRVESGVIVHIPVSLPRSRISRAVEAEQPYPRGYRAGTAAHRVRKLLVAEALIPELAELGLLLDGPRRTVVGPLHRPSLRHTAGPARLTPTHR